jgi:hypothetical protein
VIDKLPAACKYINEAMTNESDVTEILHMLKQVVCAKGTLLLWGHTPMAPEARQYTGLPFPWNPHASPPPQPVPCHTVRAVEEERDRLQRAVALNEAAAMTMREPCIPGGRT